MTRAERRREQRDGEKQAVYQFTLDQLQTYLKTYVKEHQEEMMREVMDESVNNAMLLMLTLPMEVLIHHYWVKSYHTRIPKFTDLVLEYYRKWQDGELDMEELKRHLWEYGGVRLERSDGE